MCCLVYFNVDIAVDDGLVFPLNEFSGHPHVPFEIVLHFEHVPNERKKNRST